MEENHVSRKTKFDTLDVTNGEALVTFHLSTDLENIEKIERRGVFTLSNSSMKEG